MIYKCAFYYLLKILSENNLIIFGLLQFMCRINVLHSWLQHEKRFYNLWSHMRSLIRAFASRLNSLWLLSYWPHSLVDMTLKCNPMESSQLSLMLRVAQILLRVAQILLRVAQIMWRSYQIVFLAVQLLLHSQGNSLHALFSPADFVFKINFVHFLFKNMIRVSNGLDPYHDCHYVTNILSVLI